VARVGHAASIHSNHHDRGSSRAQSALDASRQNVRPASRRGSRSGSSPPVQEAPRQQTGRPRPARGGVSQGVQSDSLESGAAGGDVQGAQRVSRVAGLSDFGDEDVMVLYRRPRTKGPTSWSSPSPRYWIAPGFVESSIRPGRSVRFGCANYRGDLANRSPGRNAASRGRSFSVLPPSTRASSETSSTSPVAGRPRRGPGSSRHSQLLEHVDDGQRELVGPVRIRPLHLRHEHAVADLQHPRAGHAGAPQGASGPDRTWKSPGVGQRASWPRRPSCRRPGP
jgi:hypothetical protein